MKTIILQGEQQKFEHLYKAITLDDKDNNKIPYEVETRVYIVNQQDTTKKVEDLTDEEFMDIAELWGRVYTLQGFQDVFDNDKDEVSRSDDFIRFITQPLNF
jgi:hypothetical protein